MFRRFLVPVDGSPFSELAIPVALDLAARGGPGAEVHLALVYEPILDVQGVPPIDPTYGRSILAGYEEVMADLVSRTGTDRVTPKAEVLIGPVAATLTDHAKKVKADLMILTSHGRGGLNRLWLGSTAEALARHAEVPVLLLRPDEDVPPGLPPIRSVLIPLDASGFGKEIVECAVRLAGVEGVTYHLVHVVQKIPVVLSAASMDHDVELFKARRTLARDFLDGVADGLRAQGATVQPEVRASNSVAKELLAMVEEGDYDLIAMATHGRGGIGRMVIGSVADKILRGTRVPLLLHRPAQ